MSWFLINRVRQELTISGTAIYEAVLGIAERVHDKVQIFHLHAQAAATQEQIKQAYASLGTRVAAFHANSPVTDSNLAPLTLELEHILTETDEQLKALNRTLDNTNKLIHELTIDPTHGELQTIQHALMMRGAAIRRLSVIEDSAMINKPLATILGPQSVRLITVIRGPLLMTPADELTLCLHDIVIMIGSEEDLTSVTLYFTKSVKGNRP